MVFWQWMNFALAAAPEGRPPLVVGRETPGWEQSGRQGCLPCGSPELYDLDGRHHS